MKGTCVALSAMACPLIGTAGCQLVLPLHHQAPADDESGIADASTEADATPLLSYFDEVTADSPTVYLRLGENNGPTAFDETGQYSGTYPEGGVTYGEPGALSDDGNTAVAFDGTSGIAMPPSVPFAGTAAFTVELWANQSSMRSSLGTTLDHNDYSQGLQSRNGWDLLLASKTVSLERYLMGDTAGSVVSSPAPLPTGAYHYVVATFDGESLSLYIDAVLQATNSAAPTLADAGIPWTIGQQNCPCAGNGYVGVLDEVAIYSKALARERIVTHYNAAIRH